MRKLFLFPAFLTAGLIVFQSCSKQSPVEAIAPVSTNIVNATVATNGSYQLPISNPGTVTISKQASHFQLSEAALDSKSGLMVYKYIPSLDYSGTDEVVLSNTRISIVTGSGCSNNHGSNAETTTKSTSYITLKINIAN